MISILLDARPSLDGNWRAALRMLLTASALARKSERFAMTVVLNRKSLEVIPAELPSNVEIATTSAVHLPLPLLGFDRARRLVERNTESIERAVGRRATGLFPPLLCFDPFLSRIAVELGLSWVAADELSYNGRLGAIPFGGRFGSVVFVGREPSMKLSFGSYQHAGMLPPFAVMSTVPEALADSPLLEDLLAVDLARARDLPTGAPVEPIAAGPRTWPEDLERGLPFPTWSHPENRPQELLWDFVRRVIDTAPECEDVNGSMLLYASCRPHWDPARVSEWLAPLERTPELRAMASDIRRSMREFDDTRRRLRLQNDFMHRHSDPQSRLLYGDHAVPAWHTEEQDTPIYPFEQQAYWGAPKPSDGFGAPRGAQNRPTDLGHGRK